MTTINRKRARFIKKLEAMAGKFFVIGGAHNGFYENISGFDEIGPRIAISRSVLLELLREGPVLEGAIGTTFKETKP